MSTTSRLISGSAASWIRILITMLAQVMLVPIYLSYWTVQTFGIWIAAQAILDLMTTLDRGHQDYLEYKFLKLGTKDSITISSNLSSGVLIGLLISLLQVFLILMFIQFDIVPTLLGENKINDPEIIKDGGMLLLILSVGWLFNSSVSGLLSRVLSPFGYKPRMIWWGVVSDICSTIIPVIAVLYHASLLQTGIVLTLVTFCYSLVQTIDMLVILRKVNVKLQMPSFKLGWQNFSFSLALSGRMALELIRQQGARVILAPLAGSVGLVAFSTMRTGANVTLKGLRTITTPLLPELVRFLNNRDQEKMEASFGTIWMILVIFLAPAVTILQAFIEPLFDFWTRGRIEFNPMLFALLSLGVLIYTLAQPAISIVLGNNILRPQLFISLLSAIIVVVGLFILVPLYGILGAGVVLLLAEMVSAVCYYLTARQWLVSNGLSWPSKSGQISSASVWIAALVMTSMIFLPQIKWPLLLVGLLFHAWNSWRYWHSLPQFVITKFYSLKNNIPLLKKI